SIPTSVIPNRCDACRRLPGRAASWTSRPGLLRHWRMGKRKSRRRGMTRRARREAGNDLPAAPSQRSGLRIVLRLSSRTSTQSIVSPPSGGENSRSPPFPVSVALARPCCTRRHSPGNDYVDGRNVREEGTLPHFLVHLFPHVGRTPSCKPNAFARANP